MIPDTPDPDWIRYSGSSETGELVMVSTVIGLAVQPRINSAKVNHLTFAWAWLLFVPLAGATLSIAFAMKSPVFAAAITLGLE